MPRSTTHFTPSQVRSRIRQGLHGVSGQGGGVSLAWLSPTEFDEEEPNHDVCFVNRTGHFLSANDWIQSRLTVRQFHYNMAYRISEVLAHPDIYMNGLALINSVAHILVMRGNDLRKARLVPVWLGNHEQAPQALFNLNFFQDCGVYNADMEFQYEDVLTQEALHYLRAMRPVRSRPSTTPTAVEEGL